MIWGLLYVCACGSVGVSVHLYLVSVIEWCTILTVITEAATLHGHGIGWREGGRAKRMNRREKKEEIRQVSKGSIKNKGQIDGLNVSHDRTLDKGGQKEQHRHKCTHTHFQPFPTVSKHFHLSSIWHQLKQVTGSSILSPPPSCLPLFLLLHIFSLLFGEFFGL